nr:MAG TPA: hypothetical protein [Bacteriophage sp.]
METIVLSFEISAVSIPVISIVFAVILSYFFAISFLRLTSAAATTSAIAFLNDPSVFESPSITDIFLSNYSIVTYLDKSFILPSAVNARFSAFSSTSLVRFDVVIPYLPIVRRLSLFTSYTTNLSGYTYASSLVIPLHAITLLSPI